MTDDKLAAALRVAHAVLFDFDGPICSVFAGFPAPAVAYDLRKNLQARIGKRIEITGRRAEDPMEVLRLAPTLGPGAAALADDMLTEAETAAVAVASPTPGGESSLRACAANGRRAAIVSNNSGPAVRGYLKMHNLADLGTAVIGREHGKPHCMKPDPSPVQAALHLLDVEPTEAILVGDSITDIEASRAAGVRCIGYANKPGKSELLAAADIRIYDMRVLAEHLVRIPVTTMG